MIKLRGSVSADTGYGAPSIRHVTASAAALQELADLASSNTLPRGSRPLHVKLSHFEHGGFLSLQLYGFAVLPASGETFQPEATPLMERRPPAHVLLPPDACTDSNPLSHAVVVNHAVGFQIENVLTMLSSLLARQEIVSAGHFEEIANFDNVTANADREAVRNLADTIRAGGWRLAAKTLSSRSKASGLPLVVRYDPQLINPSDLAVRAPILRRVYNEIEEAKQAIDKIAAFLSQGIITVSSRSPRLAAYARDMLDVAANRTYFAHLARDAFVCGNGYLSFGEVPDEDLRLLPPEFTRIVEPGVFATSMEGREVLHTNVLHMKGAEQSGSEYGVSVLEPLVQQLLERELMQHFIDVAEAWNHPSVPEEVRRAAQEKVPMARRTLAASSRSISQILDGGPSTIRVDVSADLYFPGYEKMRPSADGVMALNLQGTREAGSRDA